ncbi:MAG TPA: hypothetical protein VMU03_17605 [Gammaproteobacteria bacterium]|nr:hypothetical protein [Gammaproteobacteria bacterium]
MSTRLRCLVVAALSLGLAGGVAAQAPQTYTPKAIVQFAQGGDRERALFSRVPALAELVKGQFGLGAADLNADGTKEIVLLSLTCDAAGCPVVVLQNEGGNATPIFAQRMNGRVAITNETVNGYNAIAAADPKGAIMTDPRTGKQIVYPLRAGGAKAAANGAPSTAPAPAAPATRPASPAPAAPASARPAAARPGGDFLPLCLLPRCLNPRVIAKSGIGTANATATAKVTAEDAKTWCAQYNPTYKDCIRDRVESGGAADRFSNIEFKASANCQAGTMTAIDELQYTYVGTWPSGAGAGRPRFKGPHTTDGTTQFEQQGGVQVASGAYSIADVANAPGSGESLAIQWEILCAGAPAPPARP